MVICRGYDKCEESVGFLRPSYATEQTYLCACFYRPDSDTTNSPVPGVTDEKPPENHALFISG